jgi:hypothetical protein
MQTSWDIFKSFSVSRGLSIQFIDTGDCYYLKGFDGPFDLDCRLNKDGNSETIDFETNFKAAGNQAVKTKVVQQLGLDSVSIQPFGVMFTAAANSTTTYDYKLPSTYSLKGGVLFSSNASVGDSIGIEVVDVDNIIGYGAGIVLTTYITSWYVIPNQQNVVEDISISAPIPAGLYFRFVYTNVSPSIDAKVVVNFMSYKVNS